MTSVSSPGIAIHAPAARRFWRDRRVFVTGATGLIGGWVVKALLQRGADLVVLVRDWVPQSRLISDDDAARVTIVRGDVGEQALLERVLGEYEIASVIHLAAQTTVPIANRNAVSTFETNIAGTWRLLEACRRSPTVKQIVLASSDKAYGASPQLPYLETMPLDPTHPYDVSKACVDLIARTYARTWGVPVAITRCANFFGGGDLNWSRMVPGTIRSLLRDERPIIRSDGTLVRDYIYVEDAVSAYLVLTEKLAEDPKLAGEAFNFSNETRLGVLELVGRIRSLMGTRLEPVILNEASGEIQHQYLDAAKARQVLGWRPIYGLDEGLKRTIAWYRAHLGRA
jgi:CDP-glucose 4,6-dehydratase